MSKFKLLGTFLYYLAWPLIWFYGPLNIRVRVIIRCKSEVLVVKNWFGPNSLQLPGGGKKFNEKPLETAIREIKEELGIDISDKSKLISEEVSIVKSNGILYRYFYVVADFSKKPEININNEITDYEWINENSLSLPKNIRPYL